MELVKNSNRENYKTRINTSAKFFALVEGGEKQQLSTLSPITGACESVYLLETEGEIDAAVEALKPYWRGFGYEIDVANFGKLEAANLILRIGSIASLYGSIKQIAGSQEAARNYLALAERLFDDLEIPEGKAQCLNKTGVSFYRNGDMETAEIYFRESIIYAQTQESVAISHLNIAMTESLRFNYEKALEHYENAYRLIGNISIFTEAKIRNGIGLTYKNLGRITTDAKLRESYFDQALIEFQGALLCYEESRNVRSVIATGNNIAFLYYSLNQFAEALVALERAKNQTILIFDKSLLSSIYDTEARIHLATGSNRKAVSAALKSVNYLDPQENSNLLANSLITYGTALARTDQTTQARRMFETAQKVASYIQDFKLVAIARLFELLELFETFGETERLKTFLELFNALNKNEERDVADALLKAAVLLKNQKCLRDKPLPDLSKTAALVPETLPVEFSLDKFLKEIAREFSMKAINEAKGNQSYAAKLLGMSRQTFHAMIKKDFADLLPQLKSIKRK